MTLRKSSWKRLGLLALILAVMFTFAACDSDNGDDEEALTIKSVEDVADVTVPVGTSSDTIIEDELPATVEVTLSDDSTKDTDVTWEEPEDFASDTAETYTFEGSFKVEGEDLTGTVDADVTLEEVDTGSVTMTITDSAGDPIEDATVTLSPAAEVSALSDYSGTTDANGEVTIENVPYGDYDYTVEKDGYETQSGSVTVDSDEVDVDDPVEVPAVDAEALVEIYEDIDPDEIESYDQVEGIEDKETAARDAVEDLDDEVKKNELTGRIDEQAAEIEDALQEFVDAVTPGAGNQFELLEALEDFFLNVDQDHIVAYDYLVNTGDPITGDPVDTNTVQDIQENVIDAAPEIIDEIQTAEEVVDAVYDAVDSGNEFNLENTLEFYQDHFERLVFDGDHIAEYIDTITVDFNYTSATDELEEVQGEIDDANNTLADDAVTTALAGIDKDELDYANDLVANLSEDDGEKEGLQADVEDHYLILDVNEARTTSAMADAVAALEDHSDYTEFDVSDDSSVLADYVDAVQDATVDDDDINTIAGANGGGGIKDVIETVNAEFSHFEVAELTEDTENTLTFTINALNKIEGDFTVPSESFDVDVTLGEEETVTGTVTGNDFNNTSSVDVATNISLDEVGEYAATLEFTHDDVDYALNGDVVIETDPTEADSTVETDAVEYASGDEIAFTVTLGYDVNGESTVLTTVDDTYSATITIPGDESDSTYNEELDFTDGVAEVVVDARYAGTDVTPEVAISDLAGGLTLTADETITIEPGEPAELDVSAGALTTGDGTDKTADFTITVTDELNTVEDYEGTKTAQVTIYDDEDEEIAPQAVGDVDYTGSVNLDFTAGVFDATVDFTDLLAEYDLEGLNSEDTVEFEVDGVKGSVELE